MGNFNWANRGISKNASSSSKFSGKAGIVLTIPQTPAKTKAKAIFKLSKGAYTALGLAEGSEIVVHTENDNLYIYNVTGVEGVNSNVKLKVTNGGNFTSKTLLLTLNANLTWLNSAAGDYDLVMENQEVPDANNAPVAILQGVVDAQGNTAPTIEEEEADARQEEFEPSLID